MDEGGARQKWWVPKPEEERQKFKKQVLCPKGSRAWVDCGQEGEEEVVSIQERLEVAAASVKATTVATWNKSKAKVPSAIRKYGGGGAMQEPCVETCP